MKSARDMLEHFDEYARGDGRLQRRATDELDIDALEATAMFWVAATTRGGRIVDHDSTASGLVRISDARGVSTAIRVHAMHESAPNVASVNGLRG